MATKTTEKSGTNNITETEVFGPVGYLSVCLAHIRAGHSIADVEYGCIAVAPTQTEVDQARRMAEVIAEGYGQADEPEETS